MKNIDYFKNWLKNLDLNKNDFAVFGSWPLYLRWITDKITDIDLIVRAQNWNEATKLGKLKIINGNENIEINAELEIWKQRKPGDWDTDNLIDTADIFDGIKFVTLENVLKWKTIYNRDKDKIHIKLIEEYLKSNNK